MQQSLISDLSSKKQKKLGAAWNFTGELFWFLRSIVHVCEVHGKFQFVTNDSARSHKLGGQRSVPSQLEYPTAPPVTIKEPTGRSVK